MFPVTHVLEICLFFCLYVRFFIDFVHFYPIKFADRESSDIFLFYIYI